MSAYYLIFTFALFIIVDYKYIYSFVDSKILYSTSGSKLNYETSRENDFQKILNEFKSYHIIDICILLVCALVLNLLIAIISSYFLGQTPIILNIFSKELNLTDILSSVWNKFKVIYFVSMSIFSVIVITVFRLKILNFAKRYVKGILKEESVHEELDESGYIIAKTEDDEVVSITDDAMYQNVLITGSIGSGKTSGAICNILYNLIKSGKGGLILDVKGNFVDTVKEMCIRTNRLNDLKIISKTGNSYFDILEDNVEPLEQAGKIKQIITLLSSNTSTDPYWLDKVENVLMNFFVLLLYAKQKLDILDVHNLVTDDTYLKNVINDIKKKARDEPPSAKQAYELANALSFIQNEFFNLDLRVKSIIKSEITRFTIPLITDYDIYNRFCKGKDLERITFLPNEIVVLSLNIGENRALAKILATNLKLSFQKYILSKIGNAFPMFFVADEFQEFCNTEDGHFLSLSREAKCMNIIAVQSYSSIKNTLKDSATVNVLVQNLVNKIWFRNDDNYTISEAIKQLGKMEVIRENSSIQESGTESKKYIFKEGFKNKKSSISKTLSYSKTKENIYDENFFTRELATFEALAFITDGMKVKEPKKIIFERWK